MGTEDHLIHIFLLAQIAEDGERIYGSVEEGELQLEAVIASLDGARLYRDRLTGNKSEAEELGGELAEKLLAAGGLEIMQELGLLLDR